MTWQQGRFSCAAVLAAAAVAMGGCAMSTAPSEDVGEATGAVGALDLGGRCSRYRGLAWLRVDGGGIEARLVRGERDASVRDTDDQAEVRLRVDPAALRDPGVRRLAGTLTWRGDAAPTFDPDEDGALVDAGLALRVPFPGRPLAAPRTVRLEGTLTVEGTATGDRDVAVDLGIEGDVPPVQPGCGGGADLTLRFELLR